MKQSNYDILNSRFSLETAFLQQMEKRVGTGFLFFVPSGDKGINFRGKVVPVARSSKYYIRLFHY